MTLNKEPSDEEHLASLNERLKLLEASIDFYRNQHRPMVLTIGVAIQEGRMQDAETLIRQQEHLGSKMMTDISELKEVLYGLYSFQKFKERK